MEKLGRYVTTTSGKYQENGHLACVVLCSTQKKEHTGSAHNCTQFSHHIATVNINAISLKKGLHCFSKVGLAFAALDN